MVDATDFIGVVEALLDNDRFHKLLQRGLEVTLKTRMEVLPVDDGIARLTYDHGLPEVIRAVAKVAQAHGELHIAGKLRAVLPGMKK